MDRDDFIAGTVTAAPTVASAPHRTGADRPRPDVAELLDCWSAPTWSCSSASPASARPASPCRRARASPGRAVVGVRHRRCRSPPTCSPRSRRSSASHRAEDLLDRPAPAGPRRVDRSRPQRGQGDHAGCAPGARGEAPCISRRPLAGVVPGAVDWRVEPLELPHALSRPVELAAPVPGRRAVPRPPPAGPPRSRAGRGDRRRRRAGPAARRPAARDRAGRRPGSRTGAARAARPGMATGSSTSPPPTRDGRRICATPSPRRYRRLDPDEQARPAPAVDLPAAGWSLELAEAAR